MRVDSQARRFVGLVAPAHIGALLRLGPQELSLAFSVPARGVWATGLGVAGEGLGAIEWLEPPPAQPPGPWFGGWAFDATRGWGGFDAERWVLPEVLAWWDGQRAWFAAFGEPGTSASALRDRLSQVEEVEPRLVRPGARHATGSSAAEYEAVVTEALKAIEAGAVSKVVAARAFEVTASVLDERQLLKSLEVRNQNAFIFLVRGRDGSAFVGASPELLCEVKGGVLTADALAGTVSVVDESVLHSEKNLREHRAVVDGIVQSLEPFTHGVDQAAGPAVRRLPGLIHLHTPIRAALKPGVDALTVARALSPTPAVCGSPREAARAWLAANEGFSRGWYAGAVGFTGPHHTLLSVALRSALLHGSRATVFVGAGIVKGSNPRAEWLETEAKARTMLTALGVES